MKMLRRTLASFLVALALGGSPALAQTVPDFNTALAAFNTAQYPQAADLFVQYLRQNPTDALAHYYLAVTWHCLGRAPEANTEYSWVKTNSADPELLKRADMGLQVVSRMRPVAQSVAPIQSSAYPAPGAYQQEQPVANWQQPQQSSYSAAYQAQPTSYGAGYQQPQNAGMTGWLSQNAGMTGWLSQNGSRQAAAATGSSVPTNIGMQGRIIDLYTDWCGWCKRFEPIFGQAQAKYSSVLQFQRLNAEAGPNVSLVKKFKVQGYPTILLLDNNGKLAKKIEGAPLTLQDFEQSIFAAYPALRPQ